MRVPPPGTLKLDRRTLLRDVRERLARRLPKYGAEEPDPTDPGWLLIEQAAWMVEILSEQLDRYPYQVVQHFVRMMGGGLRPAQPSVGAVLADCTRPGVMRQDAETPASWRFFTTQTETRDRVEFVPAEPRVAIRRGAVAGIARIEGGELYRAGQCAAAEGVEALACWRVAPSRSGAFDREEIRYLLVSDNLEGLLETVQGAVTQLQERHLGWLAVEAASTEEHVVITARVEPGGAFARSAPGGIWGGGDLRGDWGHLDGTDWTPPVTVIDHTQLPRYVRGVAPMPGEEEGTILLPGIPEQFPLERLLVREAAPLPATAVEAIWRTLTHIDTKLLPYKPVIQRRLGELDEDAGEPAWVTRALDGGLWDRLDTPVPQTVAHVQLAPGSRGKGTARVGLVFDGDEAAELSSLRIYGETLAGRLSLEPLRQREAWRLPCPRPHGEGGMWLLVALDVTLPEEMAGLLLTLQGEPTAVMLGPVLVTNMPAVFDGRRVTVKRNVPEGISLLFEDVVTPETIEQLAGEPLDDATLAMIRALPLARLGLDRGGDLRDWAGVDVDASEGLVTINAPDASGTMRTLRPGQEITLDWYRRTDGAIGDVEPGAIRMVEQNEGDDPRLVAVTNPLATFFGAGRETPEAAVDRLFAPQGGTPVLPADHERMVRQALGSRGEGWFVRCWTYAERSLIATALWPVHEPGTEPEAESARLLDDLAGAGPDTLLVALGPVDRAMTDEELDWARRVVQRQVRRLGERIPVLRHAIVTRFWPLTMSTDEAHADLVVPCFDLARMHGTLTDGQDRSAAPPPAALLLNAAVMRTAVAREER